MEIVGIIGSGAMGSGIAQVAASAGNDVIVYDINTTVLQKAQQKLQDTFTRLVEKGKIKEEEAAVVFSRIRFVDTLSVFNTCTLIIEAVVENPEVKNRLFGDIEEIVNEQCILASNTSSLSITSIASACRKPDRVIGIHFFNPAPLMPLVEIIPAIQTLPELTAKAKKIIDSWGKMTVVCKDTPGFIVNRVARSFYGEAIRMMEEGIANIATIDWAMKELAGFKMGPFELMDFIGHDVNYKVTEIVWEQFFYDPRFKPSLTQKRLYEAKYFGRKSNIGFYDYRESANNPEAVKDTKLGNEMVDRIVAMLINEAIDSYYLGLASKEDIDLAMIKGVNYPKGLLAWGDEMGLDKVLSILDDLYEQYAEDRYRACVLLRKMVQEKKKFYKP